MCNRVISYYHQCIDPGFVKHMIDETGLSDRDKSIVRLMREYWADTQFYADSIGMPAKAFNEAVSGIHRRMMDELFRLALIGFRAEKGQ